MKYINIYIYLKLTKVYINPTRFYVNFPITFNSKYLFRYKQIYIKHIHYKYYKT